MVNKTVEPIKIMADTREQERHKARYTFTRYPCVVERKKLDTGDYTLSGHESVMAIERKSMDDLIGCLCQGRDRFERQLERLSALERAAVVVEGSMDQIRMGYYYSNARPHAMLQSIIAMQLRYDVPFVFAGSRQGAEYWVYWSLQKYHVAMAKKTAAQINT